MVTRARRSMVGRWKICENLTRERAARHRVGARWGVWVGAGGRRAGYRIGVPYSRAGDAGPGIAAIERTFSRRAVPKPGAQRSYAAGQCAYRCARNAYIMFYSQCTPYTVIPRGKSEFLKNKLSLLLLLLYARGGLAVSEMLYFIGFFALLYYTVRRYHRERNKMRDLRRNFRKIQFFNVRAECANAV